MHYVFQTVSKIVYGEGSVAQLGDEVTRLKGSNVVIVTDRGLIDVGIHEPLVANLKKSGLDVSIFSGVELDPTPSSIEQCVQHIKEHKADFIIGFGGGSALDSAKAASLLAVHEGPIEKYFGMHLVPGPCLPMILIPTTAGTGSEVTSISVLGDAASDTKKGIVSDYLYAKVVLLDPELTVGLPPFYTAITGLDAFVHSMESFVNLRATPFTDAMNIQAMRMISKSLRQAYANGKNIKARADLLYAATISGMGFSNTQNGVIHAMGMAVPSEYHLPHGLLMGALAPAGIHFNAMASPEKYALVAEILGSADPSASTLTNAKRAEQGFMNLLNDVQVASGLKAHGVKQSDLAGTAARASATERLMANNPRRGTANELEALLEKFF